MLRKILKIVISFSTAFIILNIFTFFINYTGVHIENKTGATDYVWNSKQYKTTTLEGFAYLRMDSNGFNNAPPKINKEKPDILLMGSSHMEALNVPQSKNTSTIMNKLLPELYTYNIGISGHQIYNCINNLEDAYKTFSPSKYIIIETSTTIFDIEKMESVCKNTFGKIPSYDTGLLFFIQKTFPAVKGIYKAISDWHKLDKTAFVNTKIESNEIKNESYSESSDDNYNNVLCQFIKKAKEAVPDSIQIIIAYVPETPLNSEETDKADQKSVYTSMLSSVCKDNKIIFVDLTDDFNLLYSQQHILAHGFSNTAVGKGHLNSYGHKVLADKLISVINKSENGDKSYVTE